MDKTFFTAASIALGLSLACVSPALAGDTGKNAAEAKQRLSAAVDWFNGKGSFGKNNVTYNGPVITLKTSSHLPPVAGISKLQRKGFDNLERMSGGKIKVKDTWSKTVHGVKEGRKRHVPD